MSRTPLLGPFLHPVVRRFSALATPLTLVAALGCAAPAHAAWQTFSAAEGVEFPTCMAVDSLGRYWFGVVDLGAGASIRCYDGNVWRSYSTADGLVQGQVEAILVDRAGNVWFGTRGGVSRFDGTSWRSYLKSDGLAGDTVFFIVQDHPGNLWFSTSGGLCRFDGSSWRTVRQPEGLPSDEVFLQTVDPAGNLWGLMVDAMVRFDGVTWRTYSAAEGLPEGMGLGHPIHADRAGRIWLGSWDRGVYCFDGTSWRAYTTADGLANDYVWTIGEDQTGCLWFGTQGGLSRFDGATWRTYTTADGLPLEASGGILEDRVGNLWLLDTGVTRYDHVDWRRFPAAGAPPGVSAWPFLRDREGRLWFTVTGGVSRSDASSWQTFTLADGLADTALTANLEDRTGACWFGTRRGLSRYDGASWRTFTRADGLASDTVNVLLEDRAGVLWVATAAGVNRYDGTSWRTFTHSDGLASDVASALFEDRGGQVWAVTSVGVSRYDGTSWRTFTRADGLASDTINVTLADRAGNVWIGTPFGVSRFDGSSWTTFTRADGLGTDYSVRMAEDGLGNVWVAGGEPGLGEGGLSHYDGTHWTPWPYGTDITVMTMLVDRSGRLWVGCWPNGAMCFDGTRWTPYLRDLHGEGDAIVLTIHEDHRGDLWFGMSFYGLARFDGARWSYYTTADGLADREVSSITEDRRGVLWFGTRGGTSLYEPDGVSPLTVPVQGPSPVSPARQADFSFVAAFGESQVGFSGALDGEPWSDWSPINSSRRGDIPDGVHTFRVRARDLDHNLEQRPRTWTFEVDATPPAATIASPAFGEAVRGRVAIQGRAQDARFKEYRLDVRPAGSVSWDAPQTMRLGGGQVPVSQGLLAEWDTNASPDGPYELRLSVVDTLGLVGSSIVEVVVDNHAPWAQETTPALIRAAAGGDVYTTNGEVHLYFPPRAFPQDARVSISALDTSSVPASLPSGATRIHAGYSMSWGEMRLEKPGAMEFALPPAAALSPGNAPALFFSGDGLEWLHSGGTFDAQSRRLAATIREPGRYAVFAGSASVGAGVLSALSLVPRVFSPQGGFAARDVAIGFTLGRAGPVTIRVYNRAGRLVRTVIGGLPLEAGANLVRWDGRDEDAAIVPDGIYLVAVEALGETQRRTLAVVR